MTLRPSVGSISLLWAVCWRMNSDLGLILQEASPDLQDQMLTPGHVPKCVICEHVSIFCDLDNNLMDCKHPTVIKSFMNFCHPIQPSALLLCSASHKQSHVANFYWSSCIEKYTHSFTHMIHQQVQFQHTLNTQQIFPELVEHLVSLEFSCHQDPEDTRWAAWWCLYRGFWGFLCSAEEPADSKSFIITSSIFTLISTSEGFRQTFSLIRVKSGWNLSLQTPKVLNMFSLLCLSLALSCDEFYRCKSLKNIQLQVDWDYFQRRTHSHSVFWGVLVCFVQSHRLFVGV